MGKNPYKIKLLGISVSQFLNRAHTDLESREKDEMSGKGPELSKKVRIFAANIVKIGKNN